jgi:Zn-finger nucleic acid-binding protein
MQSQAIEQALIDVCEECGGVWADPEDGDLATVATQAHVPEPPDDPPSPPSTTCPRCAGQLAPWVADGVSLARCDACGGTFLPRASIDAAVWLPPDAGAPPPAPLDGLAGWVRRLLGRG